MRKLLLLIWFSVVPLMANSQVDSLDFEQSGWELLGAYRDYFSQASDFNLGFVRYRNRGYDGSWSDFRWNGIVLDDEMTLSPNWSVMGGMSSSQRVATLYRGLGWGATRVGGGASLWTLSCEQQKQGRVAASLSNRTYPYRATVLFNLPQAPHGWSFSIEASRRWGQSLNIEGVRGDTYTFFCSVGKTLGRSHSLELSLFYAPTIRQRQGASTAEAYTLVGNNLYNPLWGWQGGKVRGARTSAVSQPMATLVHQWQISKHTSLVTTVFGLFGQRRELSLDWQSAPNPYPDYYRNMPSFELSESSREELTELWKSDQSVSQINFQKLYDCNYYDTPRAHYISQARVSQHGQLKFQSSLHTKIRSLSLDGGLEASWTTVRNYKEVEELFGGQYWLDVDHFLEQDEDMRELTQNNLLQPNRHVVVGERFGYDYRLRTTRASAWVTLEIPFKSWRVRASGRVGFRSVNREGFYEKENFAGGGSYGRSGASQGVEYDVRLGVEYRLGGRMVAGATLQGSSQLLPLRTLFISPEFRNASIENPQNQNVIGGELYATYRVEKFKGSLSLYLTQANNGTQLRNFYDDLRHLYTHYVMNGISRQYMGVELGAEILLTDPLWFSVAGVWSNNTYTSDIRATQYAETSGARLDSETLFYSGLHTAGSPQSVGTITLSYRPRSWVVSLSMNGFARSFIDPAPIHRVERVMIDQQSPVPQEQLGGGFTLDIFGGTTIYFRSGHRMGIYAGVNNLLNNRAIRSGGYESSRMFLRDGALSPQASRYYYALGINGFVNVSFTF